MSIENAAFGDGIVMPNFDEATSVAGDIETQIAQASGPAMAMKLMEQRRTMEDAARFQAWLRQSSAFCQLAEAQRATAQQLMQRTHTAPPTPSYGSRGFGL